MRLTIRNLSWIVTTFSVILILIVLLKSNQEENEPTDRKINELRIKLRETENLNMLHWNDVKMLKEQLQLLLQANILLNQSYSVISTSDTSDSNGVNVPDKLQKLFTNMTLFSKMDINHPGIFHYLPHIVGKKEALQPSFSISKQRHSVSVVAAIPTIKREKESYLIRTLSSLLENTDEEEQNDCVFVVFIAEPWDLEYVKRIANDVQTQFPEAVARGLIEIISPPKEFYPNLKNVNPTFGDTKERVIWRTKQNLDFCFLMMYARTKGTYYLQLEDDIVTKYGYLSLIKSFAINQRTPPPWLMLEYSHLGFIGKLFKTEDLPLVVEFFLMFYKDKPIDWLLDHLLSVKVCSPEKDAKSCRLEIEKIRRRYKPSLFQHIGTFSSLKGKVQKLKDRDFGKGSHLYKGHKNPTAELSTTLKIYQKYTLERAYIGETFFWAFTPIEGDFILIKFNPPVIIETLLFKSGNSEHPGDKFWNTTIELQPVNPDSNDIPNKYKRTTDNFFIVTNFSQNGNAYAKLNNTFAEIDSLRVKVHTNGTAWCLINEINIVERKKQLQTSVKHN